MVVYLNKNISELLLLLFKRNARIIFNSILYFNTKIKKSNSREVTLEILTFFSQDNLKKNLKI